MMKKLNTSLRSFFLLIILGIVIPVFSQPVSTRNLYDLDKIPVEKKLECKKLDGCFILTTEELLNGLRAAYVTGKKSTSPPN